MSGRPTVDLRPPRSRGEVSVQEPFPPLDRRPTRESASVERPGPILASGPPLFGEWLVGRGVLTRKQLLEALSVCHRHEWRIGDAVVVLGLARRAMIEAEAERFHAHQGRCEPHDRRLERRARRLEREAQARRTRQSRGGARQG